MDEIEQEAYNNEMQKSHLIFDSWQENIMGYDIASIQNRENKQSPDFVDAMEHIIEQDQIPAMLIWTWPTAYLSEESYENIPCVLQSFGGKPKFMAESIDFAYELPMMNECQGVIKVETYVPPIIYRMEECESTILYPAETDICSLSTVDGKVKD